MTTSAFCDGSRSKKQYVFTLAVYSGVSPGTPISEVEKIVKSQTQTSEFIKDHFVEALLTLYYVNNKTEPRGPEFEADEDLAPESEVELRQNSTFYNLFANQFKKGWSPTLPHLFWVGENLFAVCEDGDCVGQQYPTDKTQTINIDDQGYSDSRCSDFFLAEGYVSGLGCYGNKNSLISYMKFSGFNGGWLTGTQYYNVPDHEKNNICKKLGFEKNCFENSSNLNSTISQTDKLLNDSVDAVSLMIKSSTRTSTKILKDWTVYRITWDPSLMCKYGRSKNEFYTH